VEGLVGYMRRNFLVPVPRAESLEALNAQLLTQCMAYGEQKVGGREQAVNELFEEEKRHLLALPGVPFSNLQTASAKVDKYSTVVVEKNRYSVPTRYAGLRVRVVLYVERMEIFYGSQRIAVHPRCYGNGKWQLDPLHYLELLGERPQAFESARPIRQWRANWPEALETLLRRFCEAQGENCGIKEFIGVLKLFGEHPQVEVLEAVEAALRAGVSGGQAVAHLLRSGKVDLEGRPLALSSWPTLPPPDLSVYGQIGGLQ
jgi:hypothetical protein